jgi:hypothetical protein
MRPLPEVTTPVQCERDDGPALRRAIGAVLRSGRRAAEISLDRGARDEIATCAHDIRTAADTISALCVSAGEERR